LVIDELSLSPDHPNVAIRLNNLARLLKATNRLGEAEPLMQRAVGIYFAFTRRTGHQDPHLKGVLANLRDVLVALGRPEADIQAELKRLQEPGP
jgi:hypothetical protein